MFVLANFINALATVVHMVLYLYMWIIIIRALISWVNPDPYNPIVQFLFQATEPVLGFVRKKLPYMGGMDISPIIVIIIIVFLDSLLTTTLTQIALKLSSSSMGSGGLAL